MTLPNEVLTSTKQLIPDGAVAGYAKFWVAALSAVLVAVLPFLPIDSDVFRWVTIAVAVLGAISVLLVPNAIKPTPPAPVLPNDDPDVPPAV
jgi:hypothetical protein